MKSSNSSQTKQTSSFTKWEFYKHPVDLESYNNLKLETEIIPLKNLSGISGARLNK